MKKDINFIKGTDIEVLIRDNKDGHGYGYVYQGDGYQVQMFQNRIDSRLETHDEILSDLSEGKSYSNDTENELSGINAILNFWTIESLDEIETIFQYESFMDALRIFENGTEPFICFQIKEMTKPKSEFALTEYQKHENKEKNWTLHEARTFDENDRMTDVFLLVKDTHTNETIVDNQLRDDVWQFNWEAVGVKEKRIGQTIAQLLEELHITQ